METIILSTDLSDHSNNALKYAIALCKDTHSKLVVFHSSHIPDVIQGEQYEQVVSKANIYKRDGLQGKTEEFCKKNNIKLPSNIIYEVSNEKNIEDSIVHAAKTHDADLIIVGPHGTTGLKKAIFGSTTSELILKSKTPVLIIPTDFAYQKISTIVYASDMENLSKELKSLLPFTTSVGASIEVLFLDYWDKGKEKALAFEETIKEDKLENVIYTSKKVTMEYTLVEHLIHYTEKKKDGVLAMFPENRNFIEKYLFKSKSEEIATKIHLPLLTIRK